MIALPNLEPVKLTVQLEVDALTTVSVVHPVGVKVPAAVLAALRVKATLPAGEEVVPPLVSFTKATQEDAWATGTLLGVQAIVVVV
jgi:hypothetical protein